MRERMNIGKGAVLWLTGLPCSGKTTIGEPLVRELRSCGFKVENLDNDEVRKILCPDLGFSKKDRGTNIKRMVFLANLLARNGVVVVASFVSPYRKMREEARREIGEDRFVEIFVKCPVEVCAKRDVKGMYKKAIAGEIKNFTGVSDPYEEPEDPDIEVDTSLLPLEKCVDIILAEIFS